MKKIYVIATAHLDTCWLWTQEETINNYIKPSFEYNFKLADQYPHYRFNFEGSYRYELLQEYYPEVYEKLKKYVKDGKFNVTGSAFENGDVNIVSPEALIRNILYGNTYFYNNFQKRSNDIYLPDCFGFGKALPTVARHCNLIGFSTQKLTWGSSNGLPFELGKWVGNDNKPIYVAVDCGPYEKLLKDVRHDFTEKIEKNAENGLEATVVYHGTGDRGGAPHEKSVKAFEKAYEQNDEQLEVVSATPSEVFNDLAEFDRNNPGKLPVMEDEYLLTFHGVGSYTSRTQTKRFNKRCESLADISERANVLSYLFGYEYPADRFNFAWKKVIQHHFHDDITGTSFMQCYKRSYNDYVQALNTFEDETVLAVNQLSTLMDTSKTKGTPVLIFNGSQDAVFGNAKVKIDGLNNKKVSVFNSDGKEVAAQVCGDLLTINDTFKGNGLSLYDVIDKESEISSALSFKDKVLENQNYKITFNDDYEMASIIDKNLNKELLSQPIHFEFLPDTHSIAYPSWEIEYEDIIRPSCGRPKFESIQVLEEGPACIVLEIKRSFNQSAFKEIITLSNEMQRIDVFNEVDWREEATNLKVRFDLTAANEKANYDIGLSTYQRGNNTEKRYEVPAQKFADITNADQSYGISILSDSRTGWDKPSDNTVRMTAIHTPLGNYRYENSQHLQDWGINRFSYSIFSHEGQCGEASAIQAEQLNKQLQGFVTTKHEGLYTGTLSLLSISQPNVRVLAVKKALESEDVILRVCEYAGKKTEKVKVDFIKKPLQGKECYGDETELAEIDLNNGLIFDLEPYEVKSFKLSFNIEKQKTDECFLELPFNKVGITSNQNRNASQLKHKVSLAKELIDETILTKGVHFKIAKESENNVLQCQGQKLQLNGNYKYANLLMMNITSDRKVTINQHEYDIQSSFEPLGCWDLIGLRETGFIKEGHQVYSMSHYHMNGKDVVAQNVYLYNIKVPASGELLLPDDPELIVLAITLANNEDLVTCGIKMFDELEKRPFDYTFSEAALKKASEPFYQKVLDCFTDRRKALRLIYNNGYTAQSLSDAYMLIDEKKMQKVADQINGKETK